VKTARTRIERPSTSRQADFLAAVRRSRALHGHWADPPRTIAQFRTFLQQVRGDRHLGHFVCTRDGDLVGVININEIVRGRFQSGFLGYYAFEPHAGRGFMREALQKVLRLAFTRYGLHRVEANIQPDNVRSINLVQSLGFQREGFSPRYLRIGGRWRDHERWALTLDDWRSRRGRLTASAKATAVRQSVPRRRKPAATNHERNGRG
jgi:ribosomal-protein-alanine N-acetyltransferase